VLHGIGYHAIIDAMAAVIEARNGGGMRNAERP
jgi:hypothetical protein